MGKITQAYKKNLQGQVRKFKNKVNSGYTLVCAIDFKNQDVLLSPKSICSCHRIVEPLFITSAVYDIVVEHNSTDKTLIFLMISSNAGLFALIFDVIGKRAAR